MGVDLTKVASASFLPGLQNVGQVSGTAFINGTLDKSVSLSSPVNTSNLTGAFVLYLPNPSVISSFMVNIPEGNGQLADNWFPINGTLGLTDKIANWHLILYIINNPGGREVAFNFLNLSTSTATTFSDFPISVQTHLYSFPWS